MPQALIIILLLSLSVFAQSGKVVGVTDGDTITVLSNRKQIKVRLAGIDAPEKGQAYSDTAKRFLSKLIYGKTVALDGSKIDRYGRLVAKVLREGNDVNLTMVEFGLAWHFKEYEREQSQIDRKVYASAEKSARENRIFLWGDQDPVAPWDFRSGKSPASARKLAPKRHAVTQPAIPLLDSRPVYQSGGQIIGNKNSMIYHSPECRDYNKVAEKNRIYFTTTQDAEKAGFRAAKNC